MPLSDIGVTMGDPAGVGPELVVAALNQHELVRQARLVLFGHWATLKRCCRHLSLNLPQASVIPLSAWNAGARLPDQGNVVIDDDSLDLSDLQTGCVSIQAGSAAYGFIQSAIAAALSKRIDAVTTAPINKEALHAAGHHFPGHTEIFAQQAQSQRWCMMQYSEKITCTFVTVHCGYSEVPQLLTIQRVLDTIELTAQALQRIRRRTPRIVVCGLNPHAGENGLFGQGEEEKIIAPAIAKAQSLGLQVYGPVPPDTAFLPDKLSQCDAVVCMYHDQGHIPVKALAFDSAVNTTLGLSIVRTSVDHGTAFDIAWKGIANPSSLFKAIRLAATLSSNRTDG